MIPETYYKLYPYNLAKHMFNDLAILEMILPGKLIEEVEILLTERESKCIKLRYSEGMTLDQIAAEFKVTRERIRQIIAKAERKLKCVASTNRYFATTAESLKKAQLEIIELKQYIKATENGECSKLHSFRSRLMTTADKGINSGYADRKTEPQTCSVNGRPYIECSDCEHFRCMADDPQTEREGE